MLTTVYSALDHLGSALANIATSDPKSIAGKRYSVVTFWPTGKELQELHSKLTGAPVQIKDYTDAEREALRNDAANFGPPKAGYFDKWAADSWGYEAPDQIIDNSYSGPGLEEVGRRYL